MFEFIGNVIDRILTFITHIIVLAIIICLFVLFQIGAKRHENNPYGNHSKEITRLEQELDRNAEYKKALQKIHDERPDVFEEE